MPGSKGMASLGGQLYIVQTLMAMWRVNANVSVLTEVSYLKRVDPNDGSWEIIAERPGSPAARSHRTRMFRQFWS